MARALVRVRVLEAVLVVPADVQDNAQQPAELTAELPVQARYPVRFHNDLKR